MTFPNAIFFPVYVSNVIFVFFSVSSVCGRVPLFGLGSLLFIYLLDIWIQTHRGHYYSIVCLLTTVFTVIYSFRYEEALASGTLSREGRSTARQIAK